MHIPAAKRCHPELDLGLRIVENQARFACARYGGRIEFSDLVSAGLQGLERALRSHDPGRASARVHFTRNVRWAILGLVRREVRRRVDPAKLSYEQARLANHDGGRTPPRGSIKAETQRFTRIDELIECVVGSHANPESLLARRRLCERVRVAVAGLDADARELVERFYFDGDRMHQICAAMGINATRATRLHRRARSELRSMLGDGCCC